MMARHLGRRVTAARLHRGNWTGITRPMSRPLSRPLAVLFLVASMAMTGANVALGKLIVAEIPTWIYILFRFVVSALALALLLPAEKGPPLTGMSRREIVQIVLLALIGMIGFTAFMLEGVKRTAAADAGIITATLPVVVSMLGYLLFSERLGRQRAAAIAMAVGGVALIQATGRTGGTATLLGNALVAAAVLCEAIFVILGRGLSRRYPPVRLSLAANLAGAALALPLSGIDAPTFDATAVRPAIWLLGLWYALSSSVFCLLLWYRGLPHVEASVAGLTTAAIPLVALIVAVFVLGESIGVAQILGALLVIAAIAVGAASPDTGRG